MRTRPVEPVSGAAPHRAPGGQEPAPSPALPGQPVLRAFHRGAPAATRVVPLVPSIAPAASDRRCPGCGAPAPGGPVCPACGRPADGPPDPSAPTPPRSAGQLHGPIGPGRVRLILERGAGGAGGAVFRINAESVLAGRTHGAIIFPDDPCLAPHHATFFYRDGALHLRDEGAPGGLYLRLRVPSVPLRPGDRFVVGDRLLRYAGPPPPPPPGPPDGTRRLGAPRPGGAAALIEEWLEGGALGRIFLRAGPSISIGRAGCAIALGDDPLVSQAHAELLVDPDRGVRLRDLGSATGTFLRVPPHSERELHDGDALRLGHAVLRVAVV